MQVDQPDAILRSQLIACRFQGYVSSETHASKSYHSNSCKITQTIQIKTIRTSSSDGMGPPNRISISNSRRFNGRKPRQKHANLPSLIETNLRTTAIRSQSQNCYHPFEPFHVCLLLFCVILHLLILAPVALVALPQSAPLNPSEAHNEIGKTALFSNHKLVKLHQNTNTIGRGGGLHGAGPNQMQQRTLQSTTLFTYNNNNQSFNSDINNSQQTIGQRSRVPEVICYGTSNRFSSQSNKTDHYHNLYSRYKNCTHVIGNLEITWLEDGPAGERLDLSFLESIREIDGYLLFAYVKTERIRLPSLHIIRGRETFKTNQDKKDEYSMFLMDNEIRFLELPNLREIISGNVGFHTNKNLCLYDKIDWNEILNYPFGTKFVTNVTNPDESSRSCQDVKCHPSCQQGPCWSPDEGMCQQFSKTVCSPQCDKGRCYGTRPRDCCHMMCAGGCVGPKQTDCFACKNFNNDGECVPECPPMFTYSSTRFIWEPNPNGRHSYGASCVKDCPDHLLRDNGACVKSCPPNKRNVDNECVPCVGSCPKECLGVDVINSNNIDNFVNCTEIEGSITILEHSFNGYFDMNPVLPNAMGEYIKPMHPSKLMVFQSVRRVTGFIRIEGSHKDFTNLSFLGKLETIDGRQSTDMFESLSIVSTSLKSLNLRSLRRIKNGKVKIEDNKDLCYADVSQFLKSNITRSADISIKSNGNPERCRALGLTCHEECDGNDCWGPGQDECFSCRNFKLDDHCVRDCHSTQALGLLSYQAGNKICNRCHPECRSGCTASSAQNCTMCRNFMDGPFCVSECPEHKYSENQICEDCSKRCVRGCSGKSDRFGAGGCDMCHKFVIEAISNSSVAARCLKMDEPCPRGYYQEYGAEVDEGHHMKPFERRPVCKKCHTKCKSCTGYGTHKDVCECRDYMANDQCEDKCPREFYADKESRKCLKCSIECNGCNGPTEADCLNCRVYRVYRDPDGPVAAARISETPSNNNNNNHAHQLQVLGAGEQQKGLFNCTSQCPADKPHRISEGNLYEPYCSRDPGLDSDNPPILPLGSTSFFFVLIISGAIMFCVSVYRCQMEREQAAKLAMALSFNDQEPVKQSHMPPNLSELRSITTSELKQGSLLGQGVGGTVYQAVWCPEGAKEKRPVAMKILRDNGTQNMNKEFLDEAYIMASVNHPNLVKLLGVCITPKELILVTPLMPLGCLRDYVEKNKHDIGPKDLLEWSKQIANGMDYLEEHRMVHRDLALRNVLLKNHKRAVISDFGLAKFLEVDQDEYHANNRRLPIKWLAPECIREHKFTHKSDVWAFGVTIWELLTFGEKPFEEYDLKDVPQAIENAARLRQPKFVTTEVYRVMLACWFYNPEDRPNFNSLCQDFANFAKDPERYLSWKPTGECQSFDCRCSKNANQAQDYGSDESPSLDDNFSGGGGGGREPLKNADISPPHSAGLDMMGQHNRMNGLMGFEMRQHNSESDAQFGHVSTTPLVNKMAGDVFSRFSQQMSSMSTSTTITADTNNNNISNSNINSGNLMANTHLPSGNFGTTHIGAATLGRQPEGSWSSVRSHQMSINSLGQRSEQPTDSDDYLVPSPRSNEEKYAQFYDQRANIRIPPRPGPPSSRDPPHSAGLIGISNDAYFITLGTRNYSNANGNASSGNIPSSLV